MFSKPLLLLLSEGVKADAEISFFEDCLSKNDSIISSNFDKLFNSSLVSALIALILFSKLFRMVSLIDSIFILINVKEFLSNFEKSELASDFDPFGTTIPVGFLGFDFISNCDGLIGLSTFGFFGKMGTFTSSVILLEFTERSSGFELGL